MGNVNLSRLQDHWKRDPLYEDQGIAMSMSRDGFLLIMHALHFAKNPGAGTVFGWINDSLEGEIKYKRHKYEIKVNMLNNPDGFINKCAAYRDVGRFARQGKGHPENIVLHLLQDKLNAGH
ncbi:hypothetical protein PR048_023577 [Dryococelus australis]|uniref:PiggyBac transposable element-derived protein domain-containing protein n=1 Tax=Dryococelus australis TaxID=614101 RepID=A0ABQ9GUL0_9NEOP|nr:hypothetical protein PR048_023577 [Dryococelus australis]